MLKKMFDSFFKSQNTENPNEDQIFKEIEEYFKKYKNPDFDSIQEDILEELKESGFEDLLRLIQEKFKLNEGLLTYQIDLVKRAIKSNHKEWNLISRIDLQGYFPYYEKAMQLKKEGSIKKSASILCFNILINGTYAPGHYSELMVLLRKLEEYEKELVVANLYLKLFDQGVDDRDKILKRITNIEKLITKNSKK